ncbi:rRNA maturation RNase YbeY [Methylomonas sp. SURF-2]|uniref:Endoribonuclease YbeY n=1 Tax=Methylomonas subterranea TaxID=2952225 RepID=A0ABT1TL21_9GAMM|nr:rRNA maturation RNase YbeY [Methylomonas sp. SURF-2]MCQ8106014.1 rRNA maturation RNase YbeY [Methylomonas sp. SURF-2]
MNYLDIQIATESSDIPSESQFQGWVDTVLADPGQDSEIVIRLVDDAESADLNLRYRHKAGPTNILSFPFEAPAGMASELLGDLVICAPLIAREARQQHKQPADHWAHITMHGILHLLGYDHIEEDEAEEMEALEIRLLKQLNIANPYQEASTQ